MATTVKEYINKTDGPLIYVTDHAIARYLERVLGIDFRKKMSDEEKIKFAGIPPERVRDIIITREEEIRILNGDIKYFHKGKIKLVIKNLSIITVIAKED